MNQLIRHWQLHQLKKRGYINKDAARELNVSLSTVEKDLNFIRHTVGIEPDAKHHEFFQAVTDYVTSQ
jgi:DNA-binding NarL/FixJ family response regulator